MSGLALAATPLIAHHSFAAQYDRAKQATAVLGEEEILALARQ